MVDDFLNVLLESIRNISNLIILLFIAIPSQSEVIKEIKVTGNKRVVFDNKLTGTNKLIIGATNQIVFGSSFDGSDHSGIIEVLGNNAKLTANVADDGTFVASGNKISIFVL